MNRKKGKVKVLLPTVNNNAEEYELIDNFKDSTGVKAREMTRKERNSCMKRSLDSVVLELPQGMKIYCFISEIDMNNLTPDELNKKSKHLAEAK